MSSRKPKGYWTLERCMEDALRYTTRFVWKSANGSAYNAAQRKGWLEQCCEHMEQVRSPNGHWSLERCMVDASQYSSRTAWQDESNIVYRTAHRNGWLEQCCGHMTGVVHKRKGYWTLDRCMENALQYSSRSAWSAANHSAYSTASRNGWLDQCCDHMDLGYGGTKNDVIYVWRDAGTDLHKVGVTSERLGEQRIDICKRHNNMDPRIVFMLKVDDARAVESELLKLGTDPELDSSIDGYTEFRRLTDAELGRAVSIAYEAAIAA